MFLCTDNARYDESHHKADHARYHETNHGSHHSTNHDSIIYRSKRSAVSN